MLYIVQKLPELNFITPVMEVKYFSLTNDDVIKVFTTKNFFEYKYEIYNKGNKFFEKQLSREEYYKLLTGNKISDPVVKVRCMTNFKGKFFECHIYKNKAEGFYILKCQEGEDSLNIKDYENFGIIAKFNNDDLIKIEKKISNAKVFNKLEFKNEG